ncbi:MAG TPA: hypothetical protein VIO13_08865 [Candidatus Dormibacteraeota bacterium]
MGAARAAGLIDRHPQNLPVPLGGAAPVRVRRRRRRRAVRTVVQAVVISAGISCATAGLALLVVPPAVAVSLLGDRLEVGSMVLREVGPIPGTKATLYGGDASYVLAELGDGSAVAAASWASSGRASSGVCNLRPVGARLIDECTFTVTAGRLTSVDVLDPSNGPHWQRTYDDGVRVTIMVSPNGAAVPVPFPIGH